MPKGRTVRRAITITAHDGKQYVIGPMPADLSQVMICPNGEAEDDGSASNRE